MKTNPTLLLSFYFKKKVSTVQQPMLTKELDCAYAISGKTQV